jgi:hypothetical protein
MGILFFWGASSVEPTVLSCLALLSSQQLQESGVAGELVNPAARWLADIQSPEGWLDCLRIRGLRVSNLELGSIEEGVKDRSRLPLFEEPASTRKKK